MFILYSFLACILIRISSLSDFIKIHSKREELMWVQTDKHCNTTVIKLLFWLAWGPTWWCSWLRHSTTIWNVVGSIPNAVTGIFHWHNPGCTMALGLTQCLTEMSTIRNISWGCRANNLTTFTWHCLDSWSLNLLELLGPVQGLFYCFFYYHYSIFVGNVHVVQLQKRQVTEWCWTPIV